MPGHAELGLSIGRRIFRVHQLKFRLDFLGKLGGRRFGRGPFSAAGG
jgi:hypothetical protein